MTHESQLAAATMIDESLSIRDILLPVEEKVQEAASAVRDNELNAAFEAAGFDPGPSADIEDLVDTRIVSKQLAITPQALAKAIPITERGAETTRQGRSAVGEILRGESGRLLAIVGPCSIHDPEAALEYAETVRDWRNEFDSDLEILMRFYPEKPRSEKDWKGLISDPLINGSEDMNLGVVVTRKLAAQITDLTVPLATERLNANTPQYLNGLVVYDAIGARNAADQKAREYMSGTSSSVGVKNAAEGKKSMEVAVQAVSAANQPHAFMGMDEHGILSQVNTTGNRLAHIILRGNDHGPNYSEEYVEKARHLLSASGHLLAIVIDASHGNSDKQADRQREVIDDVAGQVGSGEAAIKGVMIESNLKDSNQKLKRADGSFKSKDELEYGRSVTDECAGLADTYFMLETLAQAVRARQVKLAA